MSAPLALDTSVAIPLLVESHGDHAAVVRWWARRPIGLAGHALAETYAVLTRLPGGTRLAPADAARLLDERFPRRFVLAAETASDLPAVLATRSARATYERVGVRVVVAG